MQHIGYMSKLSDKECANYVSNDLVLDEIRAVNRIHTSDDNFSYKMRKALWNQLGSILYVKSSRYRGIKEELWLLHMINSLSYPMKKS
jgi:hypothetical protein